MSEPEDQIRDRMNGLDRIAGSDAWLSQRPSANGKDEHAVAEPRNGTPGDLERVRVELLGVNLRVAGLLEIGSFGRLSDYLNVRDAIQLTDVVMLAGPGENGRMTFPEMRVRLADILIVGQRDDSQAGGDGRHRIAMEPRNLVVMTVAHMVTGAGYLHPEASLPTFIDTSDQRFMPLTNVEVRWLPERRVAARYPFALVQRRHIIGVSMAAQARETAAERSGELQLTLE